jgi:hypothetical protein
MAITGAPGVIRGIATRLAEHAPSAFQPLDMWRTRFTDPKLVALAPEEIARAASTLGRELRWVDDGECFSRGVIGAGRIEELLGGRITGPNDATRAAVAVVGTSLRKTGWSFHAATAVKDAATGQVLVIDHLQAKRVPGAADGVLTLDQWARLVGRRANDVHLQDMHDNVPTGSGPLTSPAGPRTLRGLGERLVRSIERGSRSS